MNKFSKKLIAIFLLFLAVVSLLMSGFVLSFRLYYGRTPMTQEGSVWVSEDTTMRISATEEQDYLVIDIESNGVRQRYKWEEEFSVAYISDITFGQDNGYEQPYDIWELNFSIFYSDKFTAKITESAVLGIETDEEVTFVRTVDGDSSGDAATHRLVKNILSVSFLAIAVCLVVCSIFNFKKMTRNTL